VSDIAATPFEEFDALAVLFGRTRQALDDLLARGIADESTACFLADETLPHIEGVEAGFRARLRSGEGDLPELRDLIARGGLRLPEPRNDAESRAALIEAMQAISGAGGPRHVVIAPGRDLAALEHARITMAVLPRTEAGDVHYPGRRSYADIAPPRGPSEFVSRIEEVESTIWGAASGRMAGRADSAWRRVYAFFDAGERLSSGGLPNA
jgi:hypothetical protein